MDVVLPPVAGRSGSASRSVVLRLTSVGETVSSPTVRVERCRTRSPRGAVARRVASANRPRTSYPARDHCLHCLHCGGTDARNSVVDMGLVVLSLTAVPVQESSNLGHTASYITNILEVFADSHPD